MRVAGSQPGQLDIGDNCNSSPAQCSVLLGECPHLSCKCNFAIREVAQCLHVESVPISKLLFVFKHLFSIVIVS